MAEVDVAPTFGSELKVRILDISSMEDWPVLYWYASG